MYRSDEKQIDKNRKAERAAKQLDAYSYFHDQAREAQNDSNRAYGFRVKVAR